jgi:hypothetical protein
MSGALMVLFLPCRSRLGGLQARYSAVGLELAVHYIAVGLELAVHYSAVGLELAVPCRSSLRSWFESRSTDLQIPFKYR